MFQNQRGSRFSRSRLPRSSMSTSTSMIPKFASGLLRSRFLPGILAVIGIDCAFLYIFAMIKAPISPEEVDSFVEAAFYPRSKAQLTFDFIEKSWIAVMLGLTPAFIASLIRVRGPAILLPIFVASVLVFSFWLYSDLHHNLESAVTTVQGEVPSFDAYIVKLVLIGIAILSPPAFTVLYYRVSIMDRYVVRSFGTPFLLCLFGIVSIMIIMDLGDNGGDFMEASADIMTVLRFYVIQIPFMIVSVIDASLLLALLYALGRMSRVQRNHLDARFRPGHASRVAAADIHRLLLCFGVVGIQLRMGPARGAAQGRDAQED